MLNFDFIFLCSIVLDPATGLLEARRELVLDPVTGDLVEVAVE